MTTAATKILIQIVECSSPKLSRYKLCLLADQLELFAKPGSRSTKIGRLLSWRVARRCSAGRPVEFRNPPERLAGDRRGTGRGEFLEAPAHMCPAGREHEAALGCAHAIAAISIDLQGSGKDRDFFGPRPNGLEISCPLDRQPARSRWPAIVLTLFIRIHLCRRCRDAHVGRWRGGCRPEPADLAKAARTLRPAVCKL